LKSAIPCPGKSVDILDRSFVGYALGVSTKRGVRPEPWRPFSPSVTLSPNATNVLTPRTDDSSVTTKLQEASRSSRSLPRHVTVVAPRLKTEPDAGAHRTSSTAVSPATVGAGYDTG
jgi:hypothetical protein